MDAAAYFSFILTVMFSPPGIANFVICTILRNRLHASIAAVVAASGFMFLNQAWFAKQAVSHYSLMAILAVVAMMITSHLAFTIGEKILRAKK
ncbi:hypothetical protein [Cohaesibacter intestini]|uniref:hypothetical protein n=1 Tax=Cohaesibacter intestini TaxID=2211145 RepID=UPI00130025CB|nr:hypothetical protein [Cohaesibacter intestini]